MTFATYLKILTTLDGGVLDTDDACHLGGALLDGGVPELELGALLTALALRPPDAGQLAGFSLALDRRTSRIDWPADAPPLVMPSYAGGLRQANALPLLALLLRELGLPVLLHGMLEGFGRVASAYILRELGIMPCASLAQAQAALAREQLAFVPTPLLAPGLAPLLALPGRTGTRNLGHQLAPLLAPLECDAPLLLGYDGPAQRALLEAWLAGSGRRALLLRATEGEAYADPLQRPRIDYWRDGGAVTLFEEEKHPLRQLAGLPPDCNAASTAAWMRHALAGETPIPAPLLNQAAACLYAAGRTDDLNQAKALVAVRAGCLATH